MHSTKEDLRLLIVRFRMDTARGSWLWPLLRRQSARVPRAGELLLRHAVARRPRVARYLRRESSLRFRLECALPVRCAHASERRYDCSLPVRRSSAIALQLRAELLLQLSN